MVMNTRVRPIESGGDRIPVHSMVAPRQSGTKDLAGITADPSCMPVPPQAPHQSSASWHSVVDCKPMREHNMSFNATPNCQFVSRMGYAHLMRFTALAVGRALTQRYIPRI